MSQPTPPDPKVVPQAVATAAAERRFVAKDFVADAWASIEPYVKQLKDRELGSTKELEAWLLDLSELTSVIDEYGSRRVHRQELLHEQRPDQGGVPGFRRERRAEAQAGDVGPSEEVPGIVPMPTV